MKIVVEIDVADLYRLAVRHRVGRRGKATADEVIGHLEQVIGADVESLIMELPTTKRRP